MKYSLKFPNMRPIHEENGGVIRGQDEKPCYQCGELTEYVDIYYETRFCSEECLEKYEKYIFGE